MPNDAQRIHRVKLLADNGYDDRVVIAHDMHTKHRLVRTIIQSCRNLIITTSLSSIWHFGELALQNLSEQTSIYYAQGEYNFGEHKSLATF